MKRYLALLALAVLVSACDPTLPSKSSPVGQRVTTFYVKDANSGRCLRVQEVGKYTNISVVSDRMCQGEDIRDPRHGVDRP